MEKGKGTDKAAVGNASRSLLTDVSKGMRCEDMKNGVKDGCYVINTIKRTSLDTNSK